MGGFHNGSLAEELAVVHRERNAVENTPEFRIAMLERDHETLNLLVAEIRTSQSSIADSLQKLVAVELGHIETSKALGRAFNEITSQQDRLHKIEIDMPALKETRRFLIYAIIGIVGLVGTAVAKLILKP